MGAAIPLRGISGVAVLEQSGDVGMKSVKFSIMAMVMGCFALSAAAETMCYGQSAMTRVPTGSALPLSKGQMGHFRCAPVTQWEIPIRYTQTFTGGRMATLPLPAETQRAIAIGSIAGTTASASTVVARKAVTAR